MNSAALHYDMYNLICINGQGYCQDTKPFWLALLVAPFSDRKENMSKAEPCLSALAGDLPELEEVLRAARVIYINDADWCRIKTIEGDFRHYTSRKKYGLIVLSIFYMPTAGMRRKNCFIKPYLCSLPKA